MPRYTYAFTYSQGGDTPTCEIEVEVSYVVRWGAPERGPTYACGGTPADPDEIDDIRLEKVEGKPRPWDVGYGFVSDDEFETMVVEELDSDRHQEEMLNEAAEQAAADQADAEERRWEERRDDEMLRRLGQ